MKTLFTLFFAMIITASVSAQKGALSITNNSSWEKIENSRTTNASILPVKRSGFSASNQTKGTDLASAKGWAFQKMTWIVPGIWKRYYFQEGYADSILGSVRWHSWPVR